VRPGAPRCPALLHPPRRGPLSGHVRRPSDARSGARACSVGPSGGRVGAPHPRIVADSALVWLLVAARRGEAGCCDGAAGGGVRGGTWLDG